MNRSASLRRIVGIIGIGAAIVAPSASAATTFTVNDDTDGPGPAGATCGTPNFTGPAAIQDAVNDAGTNNGDTLLVCAGVYSGAGGAPAAVINKSLTLKGAQAGVDARDRSVSDNDESLLDDNDGGFQLVANNITIDGFKVRNVSSGLEAGYWVSGATSGHTLRNDISTDNVEGMYINNNAATPMTIRHNLIRDNNRAGSAPAAIYSDQNALNVTIDENRLEGNNGGIIFGAVPGVTINDHLVISNNQLVNDGSIVLLQTTFSTVQGNTSKNPFGSGVFVAGSNSNLLIKGNTITNPAGGFASTGVNIPDSTVFGAFMPNMNVDVIGNALIGGTGDRGVRVGATNSLTDALDVHFNRIVGNGGGGIVDESPARIVNGQNNWWGCNEGPGQVGCDAVSGLGAASVTRAPFLVLRLLASPTEIQVGGGTSGLTADLTTNSAGGTVSPDFPNGTEVTFASDLGSITPKKVTTAAASAASTLTSENKAGTAKTSAALDNEVVTAPVTIKHLPLTLSETAKSEQKATKLRLHVLCSDDCTVAVKGTGSVKDPDKKGGRRFSTKVLHTDLKAGVQKKIRLELSPKRKGQVEGKPGHMNIVGTATAEGGRSASKQVGVKLKG